MEPARPQLLLRLTDLSDLRHLADLRRCLRAELADVPAPGRDDVVLLVSELVARAIHASSRCGHVRVLRTGGSLRVEVDHPGGDGGGDDPADALLDAIASDVRLSDASSGATVCVEVELPARGGTSGATTSRSTAAGPTAGRPAAGATAAGGTAGLLADRLERALADGPRALAALGDAEPAGEHDLLVALGRIHSLHGGPLHAAGDAARWQHHPDLARLAWRLESRVLAGLEPWLPAGDPDATLVALLDAPAEPVGDPVAAMRAVATRDLVPEVYRWLSERAGPDEVVAFLALEGGPDAGFDDLVAACQVGISGEAKLELARNYWDEMGRGDADGVHTVLHDRLVTALDMPRVPPSRQPASGLLRDVLGSLLVRHRSLQPELVGALGLLELQAGPRCRHVVRALRRVGAPADALPFYVEHAEVDPHHGKAWLDHVVRPLGADPVWAARMVRGARWRSQVNRRFFDDLQRRFVGDGLLAAV